MKRHVSILAIGLVVSLSLPALAHAEFGISNPELTITEADGTPITQAGSHPFALTAFFGLNFNEEGGEVFTDGRFKDAIIEQMAGLVGDTTAYPRCSTLDFLTPGEPGPNKCPLDSAVGVTASSVTEPGGWFGSAVFNLAPPPGVLVRLGFRVQVLNIVVDVSLKHSPPYTPIAATRNTPQALYVFASKTQLWGNPSDSAHDNLRGACYEQNETLAEGEEFEFKDETGTCPVTPRTKPFLTLPTRCTGPNTTTFSVDSWENPGAYLADGEPNLGDPNWVTESAELRDEDGNLQSFTGCDALGFQSSTSAQPTTRAAQSSTGLDFSLDVEDEGLVSVDGLAHSDIKKVAVALPQGVTINASQAEGLEVCSEEDLKKETLDSAPGEGCPEASKIGTIEVESPAVAGQILNGSLFVAKPYENEFGSLIAFYFVIKDPNLGVIVKQAVKVEPDPVTGQLISTADNMPQVPISHIRLHLRGGGRSPLVSPPGCGEFTVKSELTPWSGGASIEANSAFKIISGPDEGLCPPGGVPPFHPGYEAGTANNAAGAYSPFYMRLTRRDGEQDMTKFSTILPRGVLGKLSGLAKCPEAALAVAKARTGPHGGQEELEHPSCPASSKIGRTVAGAGVGSQLTYVPGSLYLAGPVGGDPLSVVAITPAVAGPFDAGTVVVRVALTLNPVTAEAEVDGSKSEPIPHILKGIPLNLRDLRVYADRPNFTLNATNCEPSSVRATLFGSFLAPLDPADDVPVGLQARYQAANCAALGFKPSLSFNLRGGTRRGGHPVLRSIYVPRAGDANLKNLVVRLPRSAFLDQGHIRTICTRVQFAANACPKGAEYGHIKAWTPLLDEPLEGPVYLRSSNHKLPDLVFDLHGLLDVEVAARLDSIQGGIRASIESAPDAPLSKVDLRMQGGKKGLIVNSRNLCAGQNRASAELTGQNFKAYDLRPVVRPKCGGATRNHQRHRRRDG